MGDPLNEQAQTLAALRRVVDAAGPYLDRLPERLVYDRAAEPLLGELGGPLPEEGAGTLAAVEKLLRGRDGDRDRLGRAALLPLRDRRLDARGAGRRLGRVPAGPERVRAGLVAPRRRGRDGHAGLAARARRPAAGLGRRADRQRHLRQLHRPGAGHPLVGRAPRGGRDLGRTGRAAPDAGARRRLRAPQRAQGAAAARPRQGHGRGVHPRRRSAGSTWPRCGGDWTSSMARRPC